VCSANSITYVFDNTTANPSPAPPLGNYQEIVVVPVGVLHRGGWTSVRICPLLFTAADKKWERNSKDPFLSDYFPS